MTGYRLCDNCALKYSDCKGNKDVEKCHCDYYKKPVVMNVKELAERVAELEIMANRYKWIPVSERLPSESDDYICTIPLDAEETYTEVLTFHKGRFYEDDDEWGATYHDDVLAWMPLPTPYKGGDAE